MKLYVFELYNLYLNCADNPTFSPIGIQDTVEGYRRQILNDPDTAHKYHTQEKELRYLGMFDDITGRFELNGEIQRVIELRTLFPKGYLERKKSEKEYLEKKALDDYLEMQKKVISNNGNNNA